MSLLMFAATARQERDAGRQIHAFLCGLQAALPGRFVLAVTLDPPEQTHPALGWDWVTLPRNAAPDLQLKMLSSYAAWLAPTVSLFSGEDAASWRLSCDHAVFGQLRLCGDWGPAELAQRLRPLLPLLLVLDHQLDTQIVEAALKSCDELTPVHVHCPKALGPLGQRKLLQIAERRRAPVRLFLPLKHALLLSRTAPADIAFLFRNRGRIELTICDELGTPVPEALNRLWLRLGKLK